MYSVYVTCADNDEAKKIAGLAIEKELAACANIFQPHEALYLWEGSVQCDKEVAMFLKTSKASYKELEALIIANHCYDVPCIIAMPIAEGNSEFLEWIDQSTKAKA